MKVPFEGILGNNSALRTIEFLLPLDGVEFNISELAEEVRVTRQTMTKVITKFDEWDLLKTRRIGGRTLYSINDDSPIVMSIMHFNNAIIDKMVGTQVQANLPISTLKRTSVAEDAVEKKYDFNQWIQGANLVNKKMESQYQNLRETNWGRYAARPLMEAE